MLPTVYFFLSPSCGSCAEMKPAVEEWIASRAPGRAFGVRLNPNLKEYAFGRFRVRYTPSALVMIDGRPVRWTEGRTLTVDEIDALLEGSLAETQEDEDE